PSSLVRELLPELEKTGGVVRGALGLYLQDLTPDLARAMGIEGRHGAIVTGYIHGSPARAAGVQLDDVITSVDQRPVGSARALTRIVGMYHPRERVKLGLLRGGRPGSLDVRLAERTDLEGTGPLRPPTEEPEQPPEEMVPMRLGVEIGDVTPEIE